MDESLLDAARTVRPYLAELLPDEQERRRLDERIAALLSAANNGQEVTAALEEALSSPGIVRMWVADVRRDPLRRPPDLRPGRRGGTYTPMPGDIGDIDAPKYRCPEGDYIWYRRHVGRQIPRCPTHGLGLVPC
jgi:hypothetical protein